MEATSPATPPEDLAAADLEWGILYVELWLALLKQWSWSLRGSTPRFEHYELFADLYPEAYEESDRLWEAYLATHEDGSGRLWHVYPSWIDHQLGR